MNDEEQAKKMCVSIDPFIPVVSVIIADTFILYGSKSARLGIRFRFKLQLRGFTIRLSVEQL